MPATAPYVVMTGGSAGWAVWPSGSAWLVLQTTDGFAHVTNRTPVAVETDGGLIGSFATDHAAVAVGAHNRLLRSPLLTWTGGVAWVPTELPDAVSDARDAVSIAGRSETAVTAGGTVLTKTATGWSTVADVRPPRPGRGSAYRQHRLGQRVARVVDRARARGPADGVSDVRRWRRLDSCAAGHGFSRGRPRSVWSRCLVAASGHRRRGHRARSAHRRWWAHLDDRAPRCRSPPASPHGAVSATRSGPPPTSEALNASLRPTDGGNEWVDRGPAPAGLTDLTPTGDGVGFAASTGKSATLWAVSADGASFKAVGLPGWVAAVGSQTSGD